MMPDLGKYAFAVLASYGLSGAILAALIGVSLWRGAKVRDALRQIEARRGSDDA